MSANMKPNYTIVKIVSMTSIFLFYSLLVMVAVLQFIMPRENVMDSNRIYKFDASWVWIKPDGTEEAIDIPYNGAVPWGETMVIETTVPDYVTDADAIMFRTSQQTVNAYIGDELRYVHDTSDSRLFGQNSNSINSFVDFLIALCYN